MTATASKPIRKAYSRRWNDKFLQLLPAIREQAQFAFRGVPVEAREELVQEVIATAYDLFVRLCRRGRSALVYATPLARFAVRHVRQGRRVGSRCNSLDITSPACRRKRVVIEQLDRFDHHRRQWRDVLIEDRTAGPAETAAARIDWTAWLGTLSRRRRRIACSLAGGETTGAVARKFRISAARISQLRMWFRENWNQFHTERPETRSTVRASGTR
jgi:hypothetical protein